MSTMRCQRRRLGRLHQRGVVEIALIAAVLTSTWQEHADAFSLFQLSQPSSAVLNNNDRRLTQVISDVDDTLKSSGGVNVAGIALGGIDVEYDRNEMYPGVAEFMYELSSRHTISRQIPPPNVAILTARAEEFKAALELKPTSSLAQALVQAGRQQQRNGGDASATTNENVEQQVVDDWGVGPVLYGSVAEWIVQFRKGLRKFTNFERLLAQDPTHDIFEYIYVGDTGELDQEAGETMLREYPHLVKAVFLHVVSGDPSNQTQVPVPPMKLIQGRPIIFFRTYVGAAAMAVKWNLMTPTGLEQVIVAAERKLQNIPKSSSKWVNIQRDIDKARA